MDRSSAVSEKQPPSPPSSTSRAKVGKSRAETPPASLQIIWNSSAHSDAVPSKPVKTAKRHISFSPTPPPEPPLGTSASKTVRTSSAREGSAGAEEDAAAPPLPPSPAAGQAAAAGEATAGEAGATAGGPDAAATSEDPRGDAGGDAVGDMGLGAASAGRGLAAAGPSSSILRSSSSVQYQPLSAVSLTKTRKRLASGGTGSEPAPPCMHMERNSSAHWASEPLKPRCSAKARSSCSPSRPSPSVSNIRKTSCTSAVRSGE
mmetsp:Transcript_148200/g.475977  ORF Transcript_148200/g.475977 Transcript_148200/m.475977 type:complete len:261 (+) Transcript_148200:131-913(+)